MNELWLVCRLLVIGLFRGLEQSLRKDYFISALNVTLVPEIDFSL